MVRGGARAPPICTLRPNLGGEYATSRHRSADTNHAGALFRALLFSRAWPTAGECRQAGLHTRRHRAGPI